MALNRIDIQGRICNDIELRRTGSGVPVVSFTLAVDRDIKNKQTGEKETDFIEVVCWNKTAEFAHQFFAKGRMTVVSGRLQIRGWTDKDGNKRKTAEVVADNMYFADSKRETENTSEYIGFAKAPASDFEMLTDDDAHLPF